MRILKVFIPAIFALAVASAALAQSNLPRNSYLEKRVNSTTELIQHVRSNSVVMDRYRRHFAMTSEEVVAYLSSLQVSRLNKDGIYTVYGVPRSSGDFHANLRMLKSGEPVFVESDGTPVLQLVCGNPLLLGPKKPVTPNAVATPTGPVEGAKEVIVEAAPAPSTGTPSAEAPPVSGPITPVYPSTPTRQSSVVPMLLGMAGAIGFFGGGGKHPQVPEPGTVLVIAGGIAALAASRRRRKQS